MLRPVGAGEVPTETAKLAGVVFPKGCLAMRVRDVLGPLFDDAEFAGLFSTRGRPAVSPGRLALVSVLQFVEGLTDRQAAHAVRARIDWKYALGLELTDEGFDHSVLCEFRARLVEGGMGHRVLDAVLDTARQAGLLKAGGRARTDSTHVLAATRDVNRLEFAVETLRAALNAVAVVAGDWLIDQVEPDWFDRYSARPEDTRFPSRWAARVEHGHQVGADGMALLRAVVSDSAPQWLRHLPAVDFLRRAWCQQYLVEDGIVRWRTSQNCPPGAVRLTTPHDPDARTAVKRDTAWDGYKVHITETCEPDAPHLITTVRTTSAAEADMAQTAAVHEALAVKELLPKEHLVDAGYVDADHIIRARTEYGVDLVGPVPRDTSRHKSTDGAFDNTRFHIDWDAERVTCPGGKNSAQWKPARSTRGTPVVRVQFAARDCGPCPLRQHCTTSRYGRQLTLRPRAEHDVLVHARQQQDTTEWRQRYKRRAGVEGTISQGVLAFGLRRSRYRGLGKTGLQHLLTAAAMNLTRINAWLIGTPHCPTRTSHFAALRLAA
ncbi:hypothetical protein [Alloactinosynnema sp. L-07]|nr:IS1182 family transposase [Alloactinosynnema sp. L-07]CRK55167.1 hypothetical protein [Alloactinosynnema sp. L-07]